MPLLRFLAENSRFDEPCNSTNQPIRGQAMHLTSHRPHTLDYHTRQEFAGIMG